MKARGYCAFCRAYFALDANPPYGVVHINATEEDPARHVHPITREDLRPALSPAAEALIADPAVQAAVLFDLREQLEELTEEDKYGFSHTAKTWVSHLRSNFTFLIKKLSD